MDLAPENTKRILEGVPHVPFVAKEMLCGAWWLDLAGPPYSAVSQPQAPMAALKVKRVTARVPVAYSY
jgi:hypothetical protein